MTSDKLSSRNQLKNYRAKFLVSKLTDGELNAVLMTRRQCHDLAAALGCDPHFVFSLAADEDCIRCLSRPLQLSGGHK